MNSIEPNVNIVELFSGIGSQAKALKNLGCNVTTLGTCEWDLHAFIAYDAIHNSTELPNDIAVMKKEELLKKLKGYTLSNSGKEKMEFKTLKTYSEDTLRRIYAAIKRSNNFVDVSSLTGAQMPNGIDVLTYSFPCQDLSNVGAFHGYNKGIDKDSGSRSSLLWQVGRILQEMKDSQRDMPKYLLMENVPTLLAKRHLDNFNTWKSDLEELGYYSYHFQLNASDFGLPQNRPRLLMISVFVGDDPKKLEKAKKFFEGKEPRDVVEAYKNGMHNPYEIAETYGYTIATVNNYLKNAKLGRKRECNWKKRECDPKTEEILESLANGVSMSETARRFGVTRQWVYIIKKRSEDYGEYCRSRKRD
jgi:DNA (cytosine-5)-methyltransferase 1